MILGLTKEFHKTQLKQEHVKTSPLNRLIKLYPKQVNQ